jgi:hypothetical protein
MSASAVSVSASEVSIGLGAARSTELDSAVWLQGDVGFGFFGLRAEPEVGFWRRSDVAYGIRASVSDFQLGLSLCHRHPIRRKRLSVVVGVGQAGHFVTNAGGPVGERPSSRRVLRPGVHILARLEAMLSPRATLYGAGRAEWILGKADSARERQTKLYAGLRLAL